MERGQHRKADGARVQSFQSSKVATMTRQPIPQHDAPSNALTVDDLVEAKKLVDELGGIDQARKALKYLEELG